MFRFAVIAALIASPIRADDVQHFDPTWHWWDVPTADPLPNLPDGNTAERVKNAADKYYTFAWSYANCFPSEESAQEEEKRARLMLRAWELLHAVRSYRCSECAWVMDIHGGNESDCVAKDRWLPELLKLVESFDDGWMPYPPGSEP